MAKKTVNGAISEDHADGGWGRQGEDYTGTDSCVRLAGGSLDPTVLGSKVPLNAMDAN